MKHRPTNRASKAVLAAVSILLWWMPGVTGATRIESVTLSKTAFNPNAGDELRLEFNLSEADGVTVNVYDPDGGLVRRLGSGVPLQAGSNAIVWDGRDEDGMAVPDEAYTFEIVTDSGGLFDPTVFSGGFVSDVTDPQIDLELGRFVYTLPAPSRVLIRLGIKHGPMHRTLVDWKPRAGGSVTEYWDGWDESHLVQFGRSENFTALITFVTLPEATAIAFGNGEVSYREYKLGAAKGRPQRPKRPRRSSSEGLRPEGLVPPAWARAPRVALVFPGVEQDIPTAAGELATRVEVHPEDVGRLVQEQFEIIFYVDNVFFAEAERGYLPFNWRWELNQLPPGEHLLTVNVSSFGGQVGAANRRVVVAPTGP